MLSNIRFPSLSTKQADIVKQIISSAFEAVDPRLAVRRKLSLDGETLHVGGVKLNLLSYQRIRLISVGKASLAMAQGVLDVLGSRLTNGLVISKQAQGNSDCLPKSIGFYMGGHPIPSNESVSGAEAISQLLSDGRPEDLVICLISGGGSALMSLPKEGTNLPEIKQLTQLLLSCGADINEINTLRKHLDRVKGGGIALMASPSRLVTLVLSDVIGSPLNVIASGPTVADPSTYAQCLEILRKYELENRTPPGILSILKQGMAGILPETLKPGDPILTTTTTEIVAENKQAADAALATARGLGFNTLLLTTFLQGEASQAGKFLGGLLKQIDASGQPLPRPALIVVGGETTVTIRGEGLGGRNQELALGSVYLLVDLPDIALVSLGTDGEDGPTNAAGAIVTGSTVQRALSLGLNPQVFLQNNDSNHFFGSLDDLVITGPTGTNVNDLVFLFAF